MEFINSSLDYKTKCYLEFQPHQSDAEKMAWDYSDYYFDYSHYLDHQDNNSLNSSFDSLSVMENYNFKVVCWDCIAFKSAHVSLELYYVGAAEHACSKDVLICTFLKGKGRSSGFYFYIGPAQRSMQQCPSLAMNVRCKYLKPGSTCTKWHSKIEQYFWTLELNNKFNREDFLTPNMSTSRMSSVPADFQAEFKLMIKCDLCCSNVSSKQKQQSYTQCNLIEVNHTCLKNKLVGLKIGSNQVFQIRPFPGISAKPLVCNTIGRAVCPHVIRKGTCTFAHSEVERAFWTAEQKNRIFREDVIDELKGVPPKSRSGSVVNGETGSRPSTTLSDYMFPRTQRQPQAQKQPQNQTQNESHYQQMPQHQQPQQPMPQQPSKPVPQYQQMPQHQPYQQQHAMPPRRVPDRNSGSHGDTLNTPSNQILDSNLPEIYPCSRGSFSQYKMSGNESFKACSDAVHPDDGFVYYNSVSRSYQFMKEPESIGVYFKFDREISMCKFGYACKALSGQSSCMFPHSMEERTVWNIMLKNNWKRLISYYINVMKPKMQQPMTTYYDGDVKRQTPNGIVGGRQPPEYGNNETHRAAVAPTRRIKTWHQQSQSTYNPPLNPLFKKANVVSIYYCRYCNKHLKSENELDTHKKTKRHKEMEKWDSGRSWKYPPPPTYLDASKLKLCEVNEVGVCPSERPNATDQCLDAHGEDMLNEWKERVEFRKAKRDLDRLSENKKFLEQLNENYDDAKYKTEVVESNIEKIEIPGLEVRCPAPPYKMSAAINERIVWPFCVSLPSDSENSLKRVALWHDKHRSHFCIKMTQLDRDDFINQIVNDNDFRDNIPNNFTFYVHFKSNIMGTFKQSIIFDFSQLPYLEIELVVDVGLHDLSDKLHKDFKEVKLKALSDNTWNERNIKVIRSRNLTEEDKELLKKYPMKDLASEVITADFMNMTNPLKWTFDKYEYKDILTRLMNIERFQCQEVLSQLNVRTNVTIRRKVGDDQAGGLPTIYPDRRRNELLFGEVPLDANISLDTERGRILFYMSYFESIWLRPKAIADEDLVFECMVINPNHNGIAFDGRQKDRLFVVITPDTAQWMADYGLLPDDYYTETFEKQVFEDAEVQFKLNQVEFSKLAQNLESIDDQMLMHLFPKNDMGLVKQASLKIQPKNVGNFAQLDERQQQFMKMALVSPRERKDHPLPPLLLYGPFGMGKTFAIGNLIVQLLAANKINKENRVLVCTWTNSAADIYIREHLSKVDPTLRGKILRLNSDFRRPDFYDKVVLEYCLLNEDRTAYRIPEIEELDQYDVVVSTVAGCRPMANNKAAMMPFTHIILDEAGQCLEVDTLIPFRIATSKTRIIMAGDPAQQAPPVFSKIARRYKYCLSPMERMFLLYHHMGNEMIANNSIIFCNNYRCVQPILDLLSPFFYANNKLIAKSTDYIPPEHYPLVFSHCQGKDMVRGQDMSYTNPEECEKIVNEINDLMYNWPTHHWGHFEANQICVLAPYHEQVKLIRQRLKANGIFGIDVQRVNNVQGREYRVVILSVVRTLEGCHDILAQITEEEQFEEVDFAFLSDKKLLNTAMSRAKNKIIVVGDASTMIFLGKCQEVWQEYILHCIKHGTARPSNLHTGVIEEDLRRRQEALHAW